MDLISQIVERAKANKQRIVLPEGTEERTLKAANQILTDGVADLILLGNWETSIKLLSSTLRTTKRKKLMPNCFSNSARKKV